MKLVSKFFFYAVLCSPLSVLSQVRPGAHITWTTYEAEDMQTNGRVSGPVYLPYHVETESSGQKCVQLNGNTQYLRFKSATVANAVVIRYSLPDAANGRGLQSRIAVYINGRIAGRYAISSRYSMLYGKYPFFNNPKDGMPRNFYNELRIKNLKIAKGDIVKIQPDAKDGNAISCFVDLADLENIPAPLPMPANAISLTDKRFNADNNDYTAALRQCISLASETGKTVWVPQGNYTITGDITLPADIVIQGAGMWYTTFEGSSALYQKSNNRVRFIGNGNNIHLSDFAITGKLDYRSDTEANDGITGSFGINSSIKNIWIEHTKTGMWLENSSRLIVQGCRIRNTIADGINFCVGMNQSVIENCTTRGTGDDCFAIWPSVNAPQKFTPGKNLIINCTSELPFLANGAAVYGGESNEVKNCLFKNISAGSAILLSTTFPTENENAHNNFSGTTTIENCEIQTSGGFDHEWGWRAAVEICLDKRSISGILLRDLNIRNSLSDAINIIARNKPGEQVILSGSSLQKVNVSNYGLGAESKYGLYISKEAGGSLLVDQSKIGSIQNESPGFNLKQ